MIRCVCPHCQQTHKLDDLMKGQAFTCPDCGRRLRIPARKACAADTSATIDASIQQHPGRSLPPLVPDIDIADRSLNHAPSLAADPTTQAQIAVPDDLTAQQVEREQTPAAKSGQRQWWFPASLAIISALLWFLVLLVVLQSDRPRAVLQDSAFAVFLAALFAGLAIVAHWCRSRQLRIVGTVLSFAVALAMCATAFTLNSRNQDQQAVVHLIIENRSGKTISQLNVRINGEQKEFEGIANAVSITDTFNHPYYSNNGRVILDGRIDGEYGYKYIRFQDKVSKDLHFIILPDGTVKPVS